MVKILDKASESQIVDAIRLAETQTSGEIRVHLKRRGKKDILEEARKNFKRLNMHKTVRRNAVLIYIALNNRQFAIFGDSGIHEHVGDLFWNQTRDKMELLFAKGQIKEAIIAGVSDVGQKLKAFFPTEPLDKNELPNTLTKD